MNLNSRIAVVTGASRGIGLAFATSLVNKGTRVYGLARNRDALEALRGSLGRYFIPACLDIRDRQDLKAWVDETFSDDHYPDILINNAGSGYFGKIDELPSEKWCEMMETNINGMYNLTSLLVPFMKRSKNGSHIINIGSILGKIGNANQSGYCTTKFAIQGFSEALFKELRHDNIKVTCINPGSIETDFFEDSGIKPHRYMLQPADIANTLIHILETPDNMLINDLTIRPLDPRPPDRK